jgi:hypothetical protein
MRSVSDEDSGHKILLVICYSFCLDPRQWVQVSTFKVIFLQQHEKERCSRKTEGLWKTPGVRQTRSSASNAVNITQSKTPYAIMRKMVTLTILRTSTLAVIVATAVAG